MRETQNTLAIRALRWLCVALPAWTFAAHAAPAAPEDAVVGTWYGEVGPVSEPIAQRFVLTLDKSGTFTTKLRIFDKGRAQAFVSNSGLWGVSNGLFFTVTLMIDGQKVDPKWPNVTNPYLVRSVTPESFSYQHIPSGNIFLVKRVATGFAMPN